MPRTRLTRRRALELGAAAVAATAAGPAVSLADAAGADPTSFALDLSRDLPRAGVAAHAAGTTSRLTTLVPTRAPHRFDLIGADWNAGAHVHVEVRARRDGGRWSGWVPLFSGGDHAPDDGGRRDTSASEPVWTGTADVFQLRYTGTARRLRARFVRSGPDADAIRRSPAARRSRAHRAAAQAAHAAPKAAAAADAPDIIFRREWGADRYPPRSAPLIGDVQIGFVHHTVTANAYDAEDSAAIVLGILRYHRDHNGWNDIGYNFLVDKFGQVFEGRDGGIDQAIVGAQAQGWNSHSTGVATLGDYSATAFSAAGTEAVAALLAWKLPLHGVPVDGTVDVVSAGGASNRYASGRSIEFERISGHRDGCTTSCPGDALYATLPALRDRALALAGDLSTGLTLRAEQSTLTLGQGLTFAGALRFTDGTVPAGRSVQVEYQTTSGQPWRALAQLPVDPTTGAFDGTASVPGSGRVRATTGDDGVHGVLASTPVRVKVLPRLGLQLSPRTTRPGRAVRVTGTVDGSAATKAQLLLERKIRGLTYRRVQTRRLPLTRGRVRATVRPGLRGTYRVTVKVSGQQIKRLIRVR